MPKLADLSISLDVRTKESKKNYENKRVVKNVSFNTNTENDYYLLTKKFVFSDWVKLILKAFNPYELKKLIKGEITIPTSLIENAIENGQFDIEEYLESKGMKVVEAHVNSKVQSLQNSGFDVEINQDFDYSQDPEYSQVNQYN